MTSRGVVLGLDLGTSGLKAVVVGEGWTVRAARRRAYPTARPRSGWAEQDPAGWWRAVVRATSSLSPALRGQVTAIGLTGMIPTLVTLDKTFQPIGPAITWEDGRAQAEGEQLRARLGSQDLYRRTGQWLDGRYLLPQFRWLTSNLPERARLTRWVAGAKDLVFYWLTGQLATDPSTATGFGVYDIGTGAWDSDLCREMGSGSGPRGRRRWDLPEVVQSSHLAPLIESAAQELGLRPGIPVAVGGADSVVGALAAGAKQPGAVAHLAGSSTVIMGISATPDWDPHHRWIVTPLAGQPGWGLETDLLSTGSALTWLANMMGLKQPGLQQVLRLAWTSPLGASGVVCLAHFGFGEQADLWDPDLMGLFANLSLGSERSDLARALLEGIMVSTRRCVNLVSSDAGGSPAPIYCGGWGSEDARFRQRLADATQRRVFAPRPSTDQNTARASRSSGPANLASAIGAAVIAGMSTGWPVPDKGVGRRWVNRPDPRSSSAWENLARRNHAWRVAAQTLRAG